jgi:hypothetical protein
MMFMLSRRRRTDFCGSGPVSIFLFVEFCGAFQRLRTVTAGEALIQWLPLMSYTLRPSFSLVPSFP